MDFQQYYKPGKLQKQLKEMMESELYPPRFRITVKVKNRLFFSKQHSLKFVVMGAEKHLQKNVTIDAFFNGTCFKVVPIRLPENVSIRNSLKDKSAQDVQFYKNDLVIFNCYM